MPSAHDPSSSAPVCFVVCTNHVRDVKAAVDDPAFEGVEVLSYPACRGIEDRPLGPAAPPSAGPTIVLGGSCGPGSPAGLGQTEHCLNWYHDASELSLHIRRGAYLLTSGWLTSWKTRIRGWGFDRDTARALFSETCSYLLLIDTGSEPRSAERLAELSDFLDRPAEVLPVGLGHLRLHLRNLVLERRLAEAEEARRVANREKADHAMASEMVSTLAELGDERGVVDTLQMLCTTLFAADRITYRPLDGTAGSAEPPEGPWAWTGSGDGFRMRIAHGGEVLGVLEVEGFTFPEHKQSYLDLALRLGAVAGLAIANARKFGAVRAAEEQIRLTADELARSNQDLAQFASVASHDLQEPLRKILTFGDRLSKRSADQLDERNRQSLERMLSSVSRMRALIDDLLMFSRVQTSGSQVEPVDLGEVVQRVLADLEDRVTDSGGRVEVGDLPTVEATSTGMQQLFQNLLGNALKFSRPGVPPVISVRAARAVPGQCRVLVQDNGIGIEQRHQEKIFGLFQRLHGRSEYDGTGIGLAICRRVVERHDGTLELDSTVGEGSTFTITLPLEAARRLP